VESVWWRWWRRRLVGRGRRPLVFKSISFLKLG
jgi:hypothetical protein